MGVNDVAWEKLFARHNIMASIARVGFHEISAQEIKIEREPRLMTKFDHQSSLPRIFKDNGLSILPISRSRYVIGRFNAYAPVTYTHIPPVPMSIPSYLTSIDPNNLYSESAALHCAYVSGMIDDLMDGDSVPTLSGRMSSKVFDFQIESKVGSTHTIQVINSQVEIDGGYETPDSLMLVEAKNEAVDDFLVRQLYYPYRLWANNLNENPYITKEVKPVFFTYSNDIFSFFIYRFENPFNYNSIVLDKQKNYIIAHDSIDLDDVLTVFNEAPIVPEPNIPFPQADSFKRIVDLLSNLVERDLTKDQITSTYDFDERQTNYYTTAGMYLGMIGKKTVRIAGQQEISFTLTERGRAIMRLPYKKKYLSLVEAVFEHKVFREVFSEYLNEGYPPSKETVVQFMKQCSLYNVQSEDTFHRRASTILRWIDWVMGLQYE